MRQLFIEVCKNAIESAAVSWSAGKRMLICTVMFNILIKYSRFVYYTKHYEYHTAHASKGPENARPSR
jgi:hypothetical protein